MNKKIWNEAINELKESRYPNDNTKNVLPVKTQSEADKLFYGRSESMYYVDNDFKAIDVFGKTQTLRKGTALSVHSLYNSWKHVIFVDTKTKKLYCSNHAGKEQGQFETETSGRDY